MSFLERQLEDPVRFARLKRWSTFGLGIVLAAEIALPLVFPGHPHFGFERVPGFASLYGLVSCVLIIVVSKFLGKLFLMRREDHHDG